VFSRAFLLTFSFASPLYVFASRTVSLVVMVAEPLFALKKAHLGLFGLKQA
jgi:hypothetical protein